MVLWSIVAYSSYQSILEYTQVKMNKTRSKYLILVLYLLTKRSFLKAADIIRILVVVTHFQPQNILSETLKNP